MPGLHLGLTPKNVPPTPRTHTYLSHTGSGGRRNPRSWGRCFCSQGVVCVRARPLSPHPPPHPTPKPRHPLTPIAKTRAEAASHVTCRGVWGRKGGKALTRVRGASCWLQWGTAKRKGREGAWGARQCPRWAAAPGCGKHLKGGAAV